MPYDNRSRRYTGSADDAALNAGVERVRADRAAQVYIRRFYRTTGELEQPLVMLHSRSARRLCASATASHRRDASRAARLSPVTA